MFLSCLKAFLVGGLICLAGQALIDWTNFTPAKILTSFVVAGVFLEAIGLYGPLADWAGAGATVPLLGFGSNLARGAREAVSELGLLGALVGGLRAAAGGITAAVLFGWLAALLSKPDAKE